MRTAGSNRLRGELAGNELRTRKEYVSDRDAGFKQPLERYKLLTRWAFEYFDQTGCRGCPSFGTGRDVGDNCKFPIYDNRKLDTFRILVPRPVPKLGCTFYLFIRET